MLDYVLATALWDFVDPFAFMGCEEERCPMLSVCSCGSYSDFAVIGAFETIRDVDLGAGAETAGCDDVCSGCSADLTDWASV